MDLSLSMNHRDWDLFSGETSEQDVSGAAATPCAGQGIAAPETRSILGRRARIVFLNDSGRIAGAERCMMMLLRNLDERLFNVSVICPEGPLVEELQKIGVNVVPLDITHFSRYRRPLNYPLSLFRVYRAIRRLDADIIHCNSTRAAHWGIPLNRLLGRKVVCHANSYHHTRFTSLVFRHADPQAIFIAISKFVWGSLNRAGVPDEKIKLVYHGVDVNDHPPARATSALEKEFKMTGEEFKIGIIGRIEGWKRQIDVIEALGLLVPEVNARLFIVGEVWSDPELEASLKARVWELGLADRVVFTGLRKDVEEFFAALDAVVMPSIDEPFGRVTIEGMVSGKPVVGTFSGCTPEIIQDGVNGLLVPVKDPKAIAAALKKLFLNRDYARELGEKARRRVLENFTMEIHVREIQRIYMEAVPAVFGRP